MTLQATHTPTDFYCAHADDNLRLTPVDGYHALVRAVIARAYWDSLGKVGTSNSMTDRRKYVVMLDGQEFFRDGRCLHLLESIGVDPELMGALGIANF